MNVFLSILGIGFLIFVHELGHFLAAKKVGIRVETFALGFQPTIAGWKARIFAMKRGDTEYVIGLLPFGGYVKMAGEELEDPRTGAADEYASKTPSQRALVLVAGAVMNLIFGFLLFILAFTMGVSFPSTEIGAVTAGSAAWEAGIRAGDRILTVAGSEKRDFTDLQTSIALSSRTAVLPVTFERTKEDGSTEVLSTELTPRLNRARGMLEVGFGTALAPRLSTVLRDSAAARAGLADGDRILGIALEGPDGRVELPATWTFDAQRVAMEGFANFVGAGTIEFRVRGTGESALERTVPIDLASIEAKGDLRFGIGTAARTRVRATQPGSGLEAYFPVGATIRTLAGSPVVDLHLWTVLARTKNTDESVSVGFDDGTVTEVPRDLLIAGLSNPGGGALDLVGPAATVTEAQTGGLAAELGLVAGDVLTAVGGNSIGAFEAMRGLVQPGDVVTWTRDGEERSATAPEGGRPRVLAVEVETPIVAVVAAGSGAARAGIRTGDIIRTVAGNKVTDPLDFLNRAEEAIGEVDENAPTPIPLVIERDGETLEIAVTPAPSNRPMGIGFGPELVEIRTSVGGAIGEGWNQSVVWGKRIFLMIGSLVRRDVSAKNLAGPVGIVHIGKKVADEGFSKLIFVLAMISINLGIFNLLPFPILDGGHLFFLLIEKLKGSPVDENVQGYVHLVAFFMLIGLAIFVTYHDLSRLFG